LSKCFLIDSKYVDNGPFDIQINRDNAGPGELPYTIVSSNFINTSNFSIGDKITINSDKLGGDPVQTVAGVLTIPPNDAKLTVTSIIDKETYYIDEFDRSLLETIGR
jgi:acetyltransferase-like isoleucine patch superfamily enzyme